MKNSKYQPIDKKVAQEMVKAYANTAGKDPKSYTKAVWFPADQILEMAKVIADGKHDGLRVYFAQYTENTMEDVPKENLGRNTVLLVPTLGGGEANKSGDPTPMRVDDIDDIENRGVLCPEHCGGTDL